MTMALCFGCGEVKFGALCPCPRCQLTSTGNVTLDIAFSDHFYTVETLEEFGAVVREIHSVTTDGSTRFWCFIHYVSTNHPSILQAAPPAELRTAVEDALRGLTLPNVTLRRVCLLAEGPGPPEGKGA